MAVSEIHFAPLITLLTFERKWLARFYLRYDGRVQSFAGSDVCIAVGIVDHAAMASFWNQPLVLRWDSFTRSVAYTISLGHRELRAQEA